MRRRLLVVVLLPLMLLAASKRDLSYAKARRDRTVKAVRAQEKIKIDGILNERVWQGPGYDDFVQSDPIDGARPSEKTVVWVAYDDKALYIAARLYDSQPDKIVARLSRRDEMTDTDWFAFAVDPYFDRRSGFIFQVSPAASISDAVLYNDSFRDYSWDGVWEWATKIDNKGWTVEIRIPFNQLRFQKKEGEYIWGVNFIRFIMRKNELDTFVWIPKEERGFVSHFAKLKGIKDINPGFHLELFPYAVAQAEFSPAQEGNPFETGRDYYYNTGLDLILGLKSNLTLNATFNPDFGQVEVDPAVINLTAYETFYEEKRPFFIEGASIFRFGEGGATNYMNINWFSPDFFYSRRIGRPPQGWVSTPGYVKFPDRTTIIAAFKLTGKIGNNWNIGVIGALTSREYAEVDTGQERLKEEVEPLSNYTVVRLQKEIGGGQQGIGFIATSVVRDLRKPELKQILADRAFSLGIDGWTFLNKNRTWVITGWMGFSLVQGSSDYLYMLQQSPQHYFQRPDATHVSLDPQATSLSGWAGRFMLSKERGNFIVNLALGAISPGFEVNDLGFQRGGDVINGHFIFGYIWYHPGKVFRMKVLATGTQRNYDFGGHKISESYFLFAMGQLLNYWGGEMMLGYFPSTLDKDLTRGGPLARTPSGVFFHANFYSDRRKPLVGFVGMNMHFTNSNEKMVSIFTTFRWKVRSNLSFSFGPSWLYRYSISQWVTAVEDPLMEPTYGKRYVFADIVQKTLSASIRINWTFTPKLSLQAYLQPLLAVGTYSRFKELAAARTYDFNVYGEGNSTIEYNNGLYTVDPDGPGPAEPFSFYNPDFNVKSLRGTVVLRWEYRPGSILYLVWTQNRADYSHPGEFDFYRDFVDMLTAPGDNIFLIKITYRWSY